MIGAGQNFNPAICCPFSVDYIRLAVLLIIFMSMATDMDAVTHMKLVFAGNLDPPPAGQLNIFHKQKSPVSAEHQACLASIKIFLNT
jgi:hypothetical protein